jgi:hypothetical protein
MLPFLALNEHFTGGKVNNYLVKEIFIGGVLLSCTINSTKHNVPECVEETLKRLVQPLVNRMNVMEEALVNIKETSATLISNQQQDKTEVVIEHHVHLTSPLFSLRVF